MSAGLCHASVGQPICHQTFFTLADLSALVVAPFDYEMAAKARAGL
jgi:hypothetical protein